MNITYEAIHAAAKTLACFEGDGWVFEPPKMDGITRSGTDSSVYIRQAREVLEAAHEAERHARAIGTPIPDVQE